MSRRLSDQARQTHAPVVVVRRPRATDAVGLALRSAFDWEQSLPEDMVCALRQIDHDCSRR